MKTSVAGNIGGGSEAGLKTTGANRAKIQAVIREAFSEMMADPDCVSLQDEYTPQALSPLPSVSLTTIRQRVESEVYGDHFQFGDDLVSLCMFWLQGPSQPNPMLPQYMAALKLIRKSTDVLLAKGVKILNADYYAGPELESADAREDEPVRASPKSPTFARKVRRTEPSGPPRKSASELRSIEQQVTMLTQHVLSLQASSRPGRSAPLARQPSTGDRPLTTDEITRLESDLMKLSPDDIDHVVSNILKDEPSVRVDEESYELDVAALPVGKQKNLRRFVTRRLNAKDPIHGANRLKQMLRDDDLARASEEMAERLLTGVREEEDDEPMEEVREEKSEREKLKDEEARRLWQLAHGDDDDE